MRLRVARLSFGSARAVELRLTLLVFLADRCQCMLGAPIISAGAADFSVGISQPCCRSLSSHRFAFVSLCAIIAETSLKGSESFIGLLR